MRLLLKDLQMFPLLIFLLSVSQSKGHLTKSLRHRDDRTNAPTPQEGQKVKIDWKANKEIESANSR